MTIVLFALAWIILGIIALIMVTRVAKKSIEEVHNIDECTNNDLTSAKAYIAKEAEAEQMEGSSFLLNMLKHPIITNVFAIIFWPIIIPFSLFGWNHYGEL